MAETGACRRRHRRRRRLGTALVGLTLIGGLSACQTGGATFDDDGRASGGYPSLGSVPAEPRPSAPIEERRQIVRELIEERDRSRQLTNVVRRRSGLAAASLPASSTDGLEAEEIIPETPEGDDTFRLTPGKETDEDTVYREEPTQFEDGSLGDFNPSAPRWTPSQRRPRRRTTRRTTFPSVPMKPRETWFLSGRSNRSCSRPSLRFSTSIRRYDATSGFAWQPMTRGLVYSATCSALRSPGPALAWMRTRRRRRAIRPSVPVSSRTASRP